MELIDNPSFASFIARSPVFPGTRGGTHDRAHCLWCRDSGCRIADGDNPQRRRRAEGHDRIALRETRRAVHTPDGEENQTSRRCCERYARALSRQSGCVWKVLRVYVAFRDALHDSPPREGAAHPPNRMALTWQLRLGPP